MAPVSSETSGNKHIMAKFDDRSQLHLTKVPAFTIYINVQTWKSFLQRADDEYKERKNEASGIILGYYFKDSFGEYVVGTHFEAGSGSDTSSVFCEISVLDQLRILQIAKEKQLLQLVWIHSHPSFGAFYSTVDYRTIKSMYYAPHQAGIVVDNINEEYLGFKVMNNDAIEFKDIYLISLDNEASCISTPFGKKPAKSFFVKPRNPLADSKKVNMLISLKSIGKGKNYTLDPNVLSGIENLIDELKILLSNPQISSNMVTHSCKKWDAQINQIETILNEYYGTKPYKDVAPYFKKLNELRQLINEDPPSGGLAILKEKLTVLLKLLPE